MDRIIKLLAIGVVCALALVVFLERSEASRAEAWEALAAARDGGMTIETFEEALVQTAGTPAEPFARVHLATLCLNEGSLVNIQRARQVAEEGLTADASDPINAWLEKLAGAAKSLGG